MVDVNDIKIGLTIKIDGNLFTVVDFQHVKPGKGSAFVRTKLRNLRTGTTVETTYNTNVKFETAHIEKQNMQFLYNQGDTYCFMNMETYDQVELKKSQLGEDYKFLKENLEVIISFYEGEVLGMILPDKIEYTITKSEPGVKGNTTSTAMKDAELENGMTVKVPMFINEGEKILVSSSDGKYVSRA